MNLETVDLREGIEPVVDAIGCVFGGLDGAFGEACSEECAACVGGD